jgi:hypothetical protein
MPTEASPEEDNKKPDVAAETPDESAEAPSALEREAAEALSSPPENAETFPLDRAIRSFSAWNDIQKSAKEQMSQGDFTSALTTFGKSAQFSEQLLYEQKDGKYVKTAFALALDKKIDQLKANTPDDPNLAQLIQLKHSTAASHAGMGLAHFALARSTSGEERNNHLLQGLAQKEQAESFSPELRQTKTFDQVKDEVAEALALKEKLQVEPADAPEAPKAPEEPASKEGFTKEDVNAIVESHSELNPNQKAQLLALEMAFSNARDGNGQATLQQFQAALTSIKTDADRDAVMKALEHDMFEFDEIGGVKFEYKGNNLSINVRNENSNDSMKFNVKTGQVISRTNDPNVVFDKIGDAVIAADVSRKAIIASLQRTSESLQAMRDRVQVMEAQVEAQRQAQANTEKQPEAENASLPEGISLINDKPFYPGTWIEDKEGVRRPQGEAVPQELLLHGQTLVLDGTVQTSLPENPLNKNSEAIASIGEGPISKETESKFEAAVIAADNLNKLAIAKAMEEIISANPNVIEQSQALAKIQPAILQSETNLNAIEAKIPGNPEEKQRILDHLNGLKTNIASASQLDQFINGQTDQYKAAIEQPPIKEWMAEFRNSLGNREIAHNIMAESGEAIKSLSTLQQLYNSSRDIRATFLTAFNRYGVSDESQHNVIRNLYADLGKMDRRYLQDKGFVEDALKYGVAFVQDDKGELIDIKIDASKKPEQKAPAAVVDAPEVKPEPEAPVNPEKPAAPESQAREAESDATPVVKPDKVEKLDEASMSCLQSSQAAYVQALQHIAAKRQTDKNDNAIAPLPENVNKLFKESIEAASKITEAGLETRVLELNQLFNTDTKLADGSVLRAVTDADKDTYHGLLTKLQEKQNNLATIQLDDADKLQYKAFIDGLSDEAKQNVAGSIFAALESEYLSTDANDVNQEVIRTNLSAQIQSLSDKYPQMKEYLAQRSALQEFRATDVGRKITYYESEMQRVQELAHAKAITSGLYALALTQSNDPASISKAKDYFREALTDGEAALLVSQLTGIDIAAESQKSGISEKELQVLRVPGMADAFRAKDILNDASIADPNERLKRAQAYIDSALAKSDINEDGIKLFGQEAELNKLIANKSPQEIAISPEASEAQQKLEAIGTIRTVQGLVRAELATNLNNFGLDNKNENAIAQAKSAIQDALKYNSSEELLVGIDVKIDKKEKIDLSTAAAAGFLNNAKLLIESKFGSSGGDPISAAVPVVSMLFKREERQKIIDVAGQQIAAAALIDDQYRNAVVQRASADARESLSRLGTNLTSVGLGHLSAKGLGALAQNLPGRWKPVGMLASKILGYGGGGYASMEALDYGSQQLLGTRDHSFGENVSGLGLTYASIYLTKGMHEARMARLQPQLAAVPSELALGSRFQYLNPLNLRGGLGGGYANALSLRQLSARQAWGNFGHRFSLGAVGAGVYKTQEIVPYVSTNPQTGELYTFSDMPNAGIQLTKESAFGGAATALLVPSLKMIPGSGYIADRFSKVIDKIAGQSTAPVWQAGSSATAPVVAETAAANPAVSSGLGRVLKAPLNWANDTVVKPALNYAYAHAYAPVQPYVNHAGNWAAYIGNKAQIPGLVNEIGSTAPPLIRPIVDTVDDNTRANVWQEANEAAQRQIDEVEAKRRAEAEK